MRLARWVIVAAAVAGCASTSARPLQEISMPAADVDELQVVATAPYLPGYDRSCSPGRACVFGPAWSDDTTAPYGRNGCDTRNDVLRAQLRDVDLAANGCTVVRGTLNDPYSGRSVHYSPGADVEVDHVYPLLLAWRMGAADWPAARRRAFANDPRNLVVTTSSVNQSKSAHSPADWAPGTRVGRCLFATRFVEAARAYGLAVTQADARSLRRLLTACPERDL